MTDVIRRASALGIAGLASAVAGVAHAAVVTQTVAVPAQSVIAATTATTNVADTFNTTLADFSPTLGTLTGVSFTYTYNFQITVGGSGGSAGGSAAGPIAFNGVAATTSTGGAVIASGGFGGGAPSTDPFTETATFTPGNSLSTFAGSGTYTFGYQSQDNVTPSGTGVTGAVDLISPSSVAVTYTYTAAVPEPASMALAMTGAGGWLLRRRRDRRPLRDQQPADGSD